MFGTLRNPFSIVLMSVALLSPLSSWSQSSHIDKKVDSLEALATNTKDVIKKIDYNAQIGRLLVRNVRAQEAVGYGEKALQLAQSTQNDKQIIKALISLAGFQSANDDFDLALNSLRKAEGLNEEESNDYFRSRILLRRAAIHEQLDNFDSTRKAAEALLKLNEGRNDTLECYARLFLGNIFFNNKHNSKDALDQFVKAAYLAERSGNTNGAVVATANITNILSGIDEFDKAEDYLKKYADLLEKYNYPDSYYYVLLSMIHSGRNELDSALSDLEMALERYNFYQDNYMIPDVYEYRGQIYEKKGQYLKAITEYENQISFDWTDRKSFSLFAYMGIGRSYFMLNETKKALPYLDSAVLLAKETKDANLLAEAYDIYHRLYSNDGDYQKAYGFYSKYIHLRDSMEGYRRIEELNEIESNYQVKLKDDQILVLNAENELKSIQLYSLIIIIFLFVLLVALVYGRYKNSIKVRKRLVELDQAKSRFFANISHEFRTPLTLITGPVQRQMEGAPSEKDREELMVAYRNANRLHLLIDQLLDLSKVESGSMAVRVQKCEINTFIKNVFSYFCLQAESSGMDYRLHGEEIQREGFIDIDKVEKILFNLISNAFKFTPEGGSIQVYGKIRQSKLTISVHDTGIGISSSKMANIFDRFFQVDDSSSRLYGGSGIGLSLAKELATIHKGTLTVSSKEGVGSEFTLEIPVDADSYSDAEMVSEATDARPSGYLAKDTITDNSIALTVSENETLPWALVVEDNVDMLNYLVSILQNDYRIMTAADGNLAWNKIIGLIPDVVVCDYMMPNMDGKALCERIKNASLTCHIPVVMVTAWSDQENKLEMLKCGADAFLSKPFDVSELQLVVRNFVGQRRRFVLMPDEPSVLNKGELKEGEVDTDFLIALKTLISENYSDSGFGIDQLSDRIGVSRTQLHRKLKAITDKTPGELLKQYRLEKAKTMLLAGGDVQVSDVVIAVGYRNLSNFAKIFKEYTGLTPSEFVSDEKNVAKV